ncbi:MAG: TetR/AcrR family transcriptional regulator [Filimonas sp.]|nr:TetR/AcrR family transcriptional regulator [Filimonas sp.]
MDCTNVEINCNVEENIKQAAMDVFLKNGLKGARMQEIADMAGINRAMLHYYFGNKEKLFELIFSEVTCKMQKRLTKILLSKLPLKEKIETFIEHFIEDAIENPYFDVFFINEFTKHPALMHRILLTKEKETAFNHFKLEIETAVARKEIKPSVNADMVIMNMISLCAYPFIGKAMMQSVFHMTENEYKTFIKQRVPVVQEMVVKSVFE